MSRTRRYLSNGMVELFNGRIREILRTTHFDTGADLDAMLWHYRRLYNHHVPQGTQHHRTPMSRLKHWSDSHLDSFRKKVHDQPALNSYPFSPST